MNCKKLTCVCLFILMICLFNLYIFRSEKFLGQPDINLIFEMKASEEIDLNIYYDVSNTDNWNEENIIRSKVVKNYSISDNNISAACNRIRVDFGNLPTSIEIIDVSLQYDNKKVAIPLTAFVENYGSNQIQELYIDSGILKILTNGSDSYIVIDYSDIVSQVDFKHLLVQKEHKKNIIMCIIVDILSLIMIAYFGKIADYIYVLVSNYKLIFSLAKNDFKTRYAGSYLGMVWAFVQPVVTILVYWFVFQVGFKSGPVGSCPYILWFMAGLIPWFFFSEALSTATNSLIEYNYLVKKVVFKIDILPIVKIISSLYVHVFFVSILLMLFVANGFRHMLMIQVLYYSICMFILVLGISYITSSLVVFFRDLGQIISIVLQIGMWLTPIMWNDSAISTEYQWILKLNPMYYVVDGYRTTLIQQRFFLSNIEETIYFWILSIILLVIGIKTFNKLKIHFADIL